MVEHLEALRGEHSYIAEPYSSPKEEEVKSRSGNFRRRTPRLLRTYLSHDGCQALLIPGSSWNIPKRACRGATRSSALTLLHTLSA